MLSLKDRLTEILINNKLITDAQLEQAVRGPWSPQAGGPREG